MKKNIIFYKLLLVLMVVSLIFMVAGCSVLASAFELKEKLTDKKIEKQIVDKIPELQKRKEGNIAILTEFNQAVSSVAKKVQPSVVNIKVTVQQKDLFGQTVQNEGVGSGVIFSDDGYIITNNHVTANATLLTVTLSDGTKYPAVLVGSDKDTDVSVIKIDNMNLKAAEFTTIDDVMVGEIAIALGSPFGLQETVTQGVISAIGRDLAVSSDSVPMVDLLQTDATINPGNSGGPLINSNGQVMGINTIIFSTSGTSSGIGFAISSDTAVSIAQQIIKYGKARTPFIGIEMGVDKEEDVSGVYISKIVSGSAAEAADLKNGDIITEFNGKEIKTPYQLIAQIQRHNVGDKIMLKIYRDGNFRDIHIILGEK